MFEMNTYRHQNMARFVLLAVTALSLGLAGCCKKQTSIYEDSAHEKLIEEDMPLGEISVFPTNISRWEDFRTSLQPQFTLNADQALDKVLGISLRTQESEVTLNRSGLAVGLPGTSTTQNIDSTTSLDADGTTSITGNDTNTKSKQPGSPPSLDGVRATPDGIAPSSFDGQSLTSDAMMRYWAAAALYQEVQLLNRIVSDATALKGYEAYVVRLQVSTMPYSRKLALDTYLDLEVKSSATDPLPIPMSSEETEELILELAEAAESEQNKNFDSTLDRTQRKFEFSENAAEKRKIFGADETGNLDATIQHFTLLNRIIQQIVKDDSLTQDVQIGLLQTLASACDTESKTTKEDFKALLDENKIDSLGITSFLINLPNVPKDVGTMPPTKNRLADIQVVPMLVTDNIELTAADRSASRTRDLALALQAMVQNAGVSVTAQNYRQLVQAALGQDYNSLLMVTKSGRNRLKIRLGALNSPTTRYAMVPRNHAITFLLLVPTLGEKGQAITPAIDTISISKYIQCYDALSGKMVLEINSVLESVELSQSDTKKIEATSKENVPVDFIGTSSDDDGTYFLPILDNLPVIENPGENQDLLLADDGKTTTVKIIGGRHIDPTFVDAFLLIGQEKDGKTLSIPHLSASVDAGGSNLNLVWPSLSNIGFKPAQPTSIKVHFDRRRKIDDSNMGTYTGQYRLLKPAQMPKPASSISVLSGHIALDTAKGTGKMRIKIKADEDDGDLKIVVENAWVDSATFLGTTEELKIDSGVVLLPSSNEEQQIDLELRELLPDTEVTLKLVNDKKHQSDTVKVKVVNVAKP